MPSPLSILTWCIIILACTLEFQKNKLSDVVRVVVSLPGMFRVRANGAYLDVDDVAATLAPLLERERGGDSLGKPCGERPVILLTGATGGIGRHVLLALSHLGFTILSAERGAPWRLSDPDTGCVRRFRVDLANLTDVHVATTAALDAVQEQPLCGLLTAAGVMVVPTYTPLHDAALLEITMGINHYAHALVARLALPRLRAASEACPQGRPRFVAVSSNSAETVTTASTLATLRRNAAALGNRSLAPSLHQASLAAYSPFSAYGQSKLANILYASYLAQDLGRSDVQSLAVHPGLIFTNLTAAATGMHAAFFRAARAVDALVHFAKTPQQGASSPLLALLQPGWNDSPGGSYVCDGEILPLRFGEQDARQREVVEEAGRLTDEALSALLGRRGLHLPPP
uniref:Protochlorophyllide reductase n=1 Tax=Sexangularia sp. CB-2014 TaxID=1486929 RepID=A0A7S1YJH1_9EUKA